VNLHQKGMLLWADAEGGMELAAADREAWIAELLSRQRDDGGWSMQALGPWPRRDGSDQLQESEAYSTAFCLWVLRRAGVDVEEPTVQRAASWLRGDQRESGRWFSRSQRVDKRHYLSHAATNMATMALRIAAQAPPRIKPAGNRIDRE